MITWTKVHRVKKLVSYKQVMLPKMRTLTVITQDVGKVCKKEKVKPANLEILCRKQGLDSGADSGFFNRGDTM